jgi:prepilin-type N-terminal cleavage/methylation domain-containing protein
MIRRARRSAYSLIELLVVMAILVVTAALVFPSLGATYGYYKVNAGMDMVRGAWAQARAAAIEQGRPYRFSVEPDGGFFRVAPDQEAYWNNQGPPNNDPDGPPFILEDKLPGGVRFIINGEPVASPPPAPNIREEDRKPTGNWTTACVFNCDGTAREDVRIIFQVRGARPMLLQLRGLTGASSASTINNR